MYKSVLGMLGPGAEGLLDYTHKVMREAEHLTHYECEALFSYASQLNDCDYCDAAHRAAALALGGPADIARMGMLRDFVKETLGWSFGRTPREADTLRSFHPDLVQALRVEVARLAALACFYNRLVLSLGIELPADYTEIGNRLASKGYRVTTQAAV